MKISSLFKSVFGGNNQTVSKGVSDYDKERIADAFIACTRIMGNNIKFPKGSEEAELKATYEEIKGMCAELEKTQFGAHHWTVTQQQPTLVVEKSDDSMVNSLNTLRQIVTNALHRHDVSLGACVEETPHYQSMSHEYIMLIKIALYLKHSPTHVHQNKAYGELPYSHMDFLHDVTPFNMMAGLYAVSDVIHYEGIVPMEQYHNIALNAQAWKPGTVVTRYTLGALNALLSRTTGLQINKPSKLGVYGESILTPYMTSEEINDWHDAMLDLERWMSIHKVNASQWLYGRKQVPSENNTQIQVPYTDTYVTSRVLTSGIWFYLRKNTPYVNLYE